MPSTTEELAPPTPKYLSVRYEVVSSNMEPVANVGGAENKGTSNDDQEQNNPAKKQKKREKSIYKGGLSEC
jgi:hypothetical protein